MHLDEHQSAALKTQLAERLENISEADPSVLADYVIALLKHELPFPELKKYCTSELEDFLAEETASFVHDLFQKLESDPIFSGADSQPKEVSLPAASGKRLRESETDSSAGKPVDAQPATTTSLPAAAAAAGAESAERPEKVARIDAASAHGEQSARQPPLRLGSGGRPEMSPGRPGSAQRRDGRTKHCFDYFNRGFCLRGDSCVYEHAPDAIVIDNPSPRPSTHQPGGMAGQQGVQRPLQASAAHGSSFGGGRGRGGRFGQGGRGGSGSVLVVQNIPAEFCTIDHVHNFFKTFGSLVNINVEPHGQRATIQYSQGSEAQAAYNSPEPIFGNRFVKVFFQREEADGSLQVGLGRSGNGSARNAPAEVSEASAEAAQAAALKQSAQEEARRQQQEKARQLLELQKTTEELIDRQIGEQKRIMQRLQSDKTLSAAAKKHLLESLKTLTAQTSRMVASQKQISKTGAQQPAKASVDAASDARPSATSSDASLAAQLDALKSEAKTLGISESGGSRAGGRPAWARQRRVLDNRPTQIEICGLNAENEILVKNHFEALPGCVKFERRSDSDAAVVQYEVRWQAEQAMASRIKGADGQLLSNLHLSWVASNASAEPSAGEPSAEPSADASVEASHEEEAVESTQ